MEDKHLSLNHHPRSHSADGFEFKRPSFKLSKKSLRILGLIGFIALVIFLITLLIKFILNLPIYSALDHVQTFNPQQIVKSADLATINDIIELPTDQNGTVGIIKDVNSLAKQKAFFKKGRNGDILIIYPDMTIIYDRENHTVVDISKESLLH